MAPGIDIFFKLPRLSNVQPSLRTSALASCFYNVVLDQYRQCWLSENLLRLQNVSSTLPELFMNILKFDKQ